MYTAISSSYSEALQYLSSSKAPRSPGWRPLIVYHPTRLTSSYADAYPEIKRLFVLVGATVVGRMSRALLWIWTTTEIRDNGRMYVQPRVRVAYSGTGELRKLNQCGKRGRERCRRKDGTRLRLAPSVELHSCVLTYKDALM